MLGAELGYRRTRVEGRECAPRRTVRCVLDPDVHPDPPFVWAGGGALHRVRAAAGHLLLADDRARDPRASRHPPPSQHCHRRGPPAGGQHMWTNGV
eukprot:109515-Prorocentrum_minimum.AAC.3